MKNRNCVFDAICLQETWLSNDADTSLFKIEGYKLLSKGKTCSAHGGLLIYLNSSYHYKNVLTVTSDIWERQLISVSNDTTNKKITIGNIYRPPRDINENYQQFNKEFTEFLSGLQKTKGEVVIVGDFNIDLLKVEHKPTTKEYLGAGFLPQNNFSYKIF